MNIGKNIKALRKSFGYTQDNLAEQLQLSTQAVSSWERGITSPDLSLLPQLANIFGITIDELFIQEPSDEITRIENMLDLKEDISSLDETYILQKLESIKDDKHNKLKAKLYLNRAKSYLKSAKELIQDYITQDPNDKESHYIYLSTTNGVMTDWNFFNKHEITEFYKQFVKNNPTLPKGYMHLLDHLIHDGRLLEASKYLEMYKKIDSSFRIDWYQGRINTQSNRIDPLIEKFEGDWLTHGIKADEYAKIGDYESAIKEYLKSYELQPSPKYYDALESIAHIHEINSNPQSKEYYKKILTNLREEWNISYGTQYDSIKKKTL